MKSLNFNPLERFGTKEAKMPPKSFYAVRKGVEVGIFPTWSSMKGLVSGFRGAEFKGFETKEEAEEYMGSGSSSGSNACSASSVPVTTSSASTPTPTPTPIIPSVSDETKTDSSDPPPSVKRPLRISKPILPPLFRNPLTSLDLTEIYVDGGHNRQTGIEAWGCVVDAGGRDLIAPHSDLFTDIPLRDVVLPVGPRYVFVAKFSDVTSQQNNGAELLATVGGLRLALKYPSVKVLKGDSTVVLTWWSRCLGADKRQTMDPRKVRYIDELIKLRKLFEAQGGRLEKIGGKYNLADLGRHV
ncbi:MAG: RNase H1/viroplasmin domain-containing protein [Gallionella sp.]|jgi:ribonuclease HI